MVAQETGVKVEMSTPARSAMYTTHYIATIYVGSPITAVRLERGGVQHNNTPRACSAV